jgi:hypothetical protein
VPEHLAAQVMDPLRQNCQATSKSDRNVGGFSYSWRFTPHWGGVTGPVEVHNLGPMIIRTLPSAIDISDIANARYCLPRDATALNASTAAPNGPSMAPPPRILIPLGRPPASTMPGFRPVGSSWIGIISPGTFQCATTKHFKIKPANSYASPNSRGYRISTVPVGFDSRTPTNVLQAEWRDTTAVSSTGDVG